jgi:hypothetical protein
VFAGSVLVVLLCKNPAPIAAYLVFVPLPFLVGLVSGLDAMLTINAMIGKMTYIPRQSEFSDAYSMAWFSMLAGLILTIPSYLVVATGLFVRTLIRREGGK